MSQTRSRASTERGGRSRKQDDERDVVLLCNPRAGGRWRELAGILDSEEARGVRRITTDAIEDIGPALATLGRRTPLVCIYGGDGTIYQILNDLCRDPKASLPAMAFIGGGTMNVTARWCGLDRSPANNFRFIMRAYRAGDLLFKDVPLLRVQQGEEVRHGFVFGLGPIVRLLDEYERGAKGKMAAISIAGKALMALWSKWPREMLPLLKEFDARVLLDGEPLDYERFAAIFCTITGRLNPAVEPFTQERDRQRFFCLAYAVRAQEVAALLPFLARGHLPLDPKSLLKPVSTWKRVAMSYLGKESFPVDPRYVQRLAATLQVHCNDPIYTIDGEIISSNGEPIDVSLGPVLRLAVSPTAALGPAMRLAAAAGAVAGV